MLFAQVFDQANVTSKIFIIPIAGLAVVQTAHITPLPGQLVGAGRAVPAATNTVYPAVNALVKPFTTLLTCVEAKR